MSDTNININNLHNEAQLALIALLKIEDLIYEFRSAGEFMID